MWWRTMMSGSPTIDVPNGLHASNRGSCATRSMGGPALVQARPLNARTR
jgi:hypothetical protein